MDPNRGAAPIAAGAPAGGVTRVPRAAAAIAGLLENVLVSLSPVKSLMAMYVLSSVRSMARTSSASKSCTASAWPELLIL